MRDHGQREWVDQHRRRNPADYTNFAENVRVRFGHCAHRHLSEIAERTIRQRDSRVAGQQNRANLGHGKG